MRYQHAIFVMSVVVILCNFHPELIILQAIALLVQVCLVLEDVSVSYKRMKSIKKEMEASRESLKQEIEKHRHEFEREIKRITWKRPDDK